MKRLSFTCHVYRRRGRGRSLDFDYRCDHSSKNEARGHCNRLAVLRENRRRTLEPVPVNVEAAA